MVNDNHDHKSLVVVDIGAANGDFTEHVLANTSQTYIFAVEPNSEKFGTSLMRIAESYDGRMLYCPFAIGMQSGQFHFYGSDTYNGQLGSLHKFNESKKWSKETSKNLDATNFKEFRLVDVKSVVDFVHEYNLKKIDFLKIDAQGSDIDILEMIINVSDVFCIVLEVNTINHCSENIYEVDNSFNRLIKLLSRTEFKIIKLIPNADLTEYNVFLAKDVDVGLRLIHNLNLSQSWVFGKYWKVLGIGISSGKNMKKVLLYKILKALKHPMQSFKSLILKLSS